MKSFVKQLIYGFLYLLVFGFVFYLIFGGFFKKPVVPTCFDNIKNQDEEGIDCGGSCPLPCYAKNALPLEVVGSFLIFKDTQNTKMFVLFTVQNKNDNVGAHRFDFTLKFFDSNNHLVGTIEDHNSILPSEVKSILVDYNDSTYNISRIAKAELSFDKVVWGKATEFLVPHFLVSKGPVVTEEDDYIVVSGTILNDSLFNIPKVRILALILDKYGDLKFPVQTFTQNMTSGSSYDFTITIPKSLIGDVEIKSLKTDLLIYAEE